jgi:aminodeoxyfutalosine synthase
VKVEAMTTAVESDLAVQPRDPGLLPIFDKVLDGRRLDYSDGVTLFQSRDLLAIGALADWVNRQKNGDRVFFVANQHLNPTNVCILRATCTFCSLRASRRKMALTR